MIGASQYSGRRNSTSCHSLRSGANGRSPCGRYAMLRIARLYAPSRAPGAAPDALRPVFLARFIERPAR